MLRRRPRGETMSDGNWLDRGDDGSVEAILVDVPACGSSMASGSTSASVPSAKTKQMDVWWMIPVA